MKLISICALKLRLVRILNLFPICKLTEQHLVFSLTFHLSMGSKLQKKSAGEHFIFDACWFCCYLLYHQIATILYKSQQYVQCILYNVCNVHITYILHHLSFNYRHCKKMSGVIYSYEQFGQPVISVAIMIVKYVRVVVSCSGEDNLCVP